MRTCLRPDSPPGRVLTGILPALLAVTSILGGVHAMGQQLGQQPGQQLGQLAGDRAKELAEHPLYMGREIAQTMHWTGARWLMRETRENEENGAQLLEWLDVGEGASVADVGCGNGYHTIPLARAVGAEGRVYAVDLQPEMLELLKERVEVEAARLGSPLNVAPILATVDDPKLPPDSCDFVLMVDVYHELSHPSRVLHAIRKALRADGVVVLVEFRAEDKSVPIKPLHKMSKAQVIAEMAANDFVLAAETDGLPWQHAMAFAPSKKVDAPAEGAAPSPPPLGATAMAAGFLDAMAGDDPRIVAPFLGSPVAIGAGLPSPGKEAAVQIGQWMTAEEASLIPDGTKCAIERTASGHVSGRLTPPEGTSIFEDRVLIQLERNEHGLWLVDTWLAEK